MHIIFRLLSCSYLYCWSYIYLFVFLYIDYISEFSIYFQYLMECIDIYLIYGSSGASLPFLTAYPANNVMGSLSHGGSLAGVSVSQPRTLLSY